MKNEEIIRQLQAPFPFEAVEAKIQITTQDKSKGMAVFYLDARAVQERLDNVLGSFGWRNEYTLWQDKSQICGLSIYCGERGEWVTKYDGAENSDIEAVKGGLTDAFKRSAVLWGIGRYLYQMEGVWVEVEQRGKGTYIRDNQQGRLKAEYDRAVAKIFGGGANSANPTSNAPNNAQQHNQSAPPTANRQTPPTDNRQSTDNRQPSDNQRSAGATSGAASNSAQDSIYLVQSVKPSGKESQLLELVNNGGEVVSAYVRNSDKGIKVGSRLRNVDIVPKQSSYGQYNLVNHYQIAA